MRLSTSTNNIHNLTQNRYTVKPAHRTKSLSTNDSTVLNPAAQLAPPQTITMHEPQVNVSVEQQNVHRKLDKSSSLPIYAQQATLPAGTTITALPGYVYAPAPTAVQLTPFYSAVPGPFLQPTIPYSIPTVPPMKTTLNSKRHRTSVACPTSEAMSSNQKQALGPLA